MPRSSPLTFNLLTINPIIRSFNHSIIQLLAYLCRAKSDLGITPYLYIHYFMQKSFIPFAVGYVCIIAGALLHIFDWQWSFWLFGAGAVLAIVSRMLSLPKTDDRRVRRLYV